MKEPKAKAATPRSEVEIEQELNDALIAAVAPFRNVLHRDRARRVIERQSDLVRNDAEWVTYEGGPTPPESVPAPTLDSLSPSSAVAGDATDITLSCIGTGFTADSIIVFNGHAEPTTLVSDTEVTTGVKPSLFVVPAVCPVEIHTNMLVTPPLDFTFTEVVTRSTSKKSRKDDD